MTEKEIRNYSDEVLVQRIVNDGETILFGHLYDRYSEKVFNKCYSFVKDIDEAKDLAQDVFLRAYLKLYSYRPEKAAFTTWLYVVTYNLCTNYVTRHKQNFGRDFKKLGKKIHMEPADIEIDIEELNELDPDKLVRVLEVIPPQDKSLLLLKYQDDASIKELQDLLGVGESAIKMRLNRAKLKVIKTYQDL